MRSHNLYLQKVHDELSVYSQKLLHGELVEMTTAQEENWDRIQIIWSLLKDGHSDNDILKLAKNHPGLKIQERRARELLYMTYEVFADLRPMRNTKALKMLDSESFRQSANMVMIEMQKLLKKGAKQEGPSLTDILDFDEDEIEQGNENHIKQYGLTTKEYEAYAKLMKIWKELRVEAGKIDGVYLPDAKNQEEKKRPMKVTIKKLIVNNNSNPIIPPTPEPETYVLEQESD